MKVGDKVRCTDRCDPHSRRDGVGVVKSIVWMAWPVKVVWDTGEWDFYDEYELEVAE